jgi:hypothetical protein
VVLFSHGLEVGRDTQFGKSGARKTTGRISVNFDATDVYCEWGAFPTSYLARRLVLPGDMARD